MDKNLSLTLTIRDRQRVLFQEHCLAVSSYNEKGIFDILPQHENFIAVIKEKIVIHKNIYKSEEIKIANAVLRVYRNKVDIYITS